MACTERHPRERSAKLGFKAHVASGPSSVKRSDDPSPVRAVQHSCSLAGCLQYLRTLVKRWPRSCEQDLPLAGSAAPDRPSSTMDEYGRLRDTIRQCVLSDLIPSETNHTSPQLASVLHLTQQSQTDTDEECSFPRKPRRRTEATGLGGTKRTPEPAGDTLSTSSYSLSSTPSANKRIALCSKRPSSA